MTLSIIKVSATNVQNMKPVYHITLFICKFLKCIHLDDLADQAQVAQLFNLELCSLEATVASKRFFSG